MRIPCADQLRTLLFEHRSERGGASADHELAEILVDHVPQPQEELYRGLVVGDLPSTLAELRTNVSVVPVFLAVFFIGGPLG